MVIQHNMASAMTGRTLKNTNKKLKTATMRLSSGYHINSAADDAARLSISEKLRWQIRGLTRASDNIQDGVSLIQVADGALQEVHSMLDRIKELTVQGANDTNTDADRNALQLEIDEIKSEINRISADTEFNTIKIFKPTNMPEIKGNPTDILVYHEDSAGGVREGGIIYSGRRYAYDDMMLDYDSNGNIKQGTYTVDVYAEDGTSKINIDLMFDGGNRIPSGRQYELDPKEDGIYIDLIQHKWSDIKDTNGVALDPANLKAGTYSFKHAGLTISFDVDEGMDFISMLDSIRQDGLETYSLQSTNVTNVRPYITPTVSMTDIPQVNDAKQDYVPGNTSNNSSKYYMYADDNEIYMYIDKDDSMTGQKEILTKMTWDDLGLNEWKRYNPDPNYNWVNPSSNVSQGEKSTGYQYHDSITGISINFTVDSEVSKGELINAINEWSISVKTNNQMIFKPTTSGSVAITAGSHSASLDAYGTHYEMGRTMSQTMTLTTNQQLAHTSANDKLSFTMTDANSTVYTFSASNITSSVKSSVQSDLRSYINAYARAYENRLNGYGSSSASSKYTDDLRFSSDTGGYYMELNFDEDFSGWINDSNFTTSYTTDIYGRKIYTVSPNPSTSTLVNNLSSRVNDLTNKIVDSLKKTKISVNTDTGNTIADNSITRTLGTNNKRYSSVGISGDRELKVQSGCRNQQYIAIKLPAMNTSILKIGGIDVTSFDSASAGIKQVEYAIDYVSDMRSGFGATQNRLEAAQKIDDITAENSQAAESLMRDADMAEESLEFSKNNILQQVGQSMLAQANQQPSSVVQLLM